MNPLKLSPVQQYAYNRLVRNVENHHLVALTAGTGYGRTLLLQQLAAERQATFIRMADFMNAFQQNDPFKIEEGVVAVLEQAWAENPFVIVDDFHILLKHLYFECYEPARPKLLDFAMDRILTWLEKPGYKLVLGLKSASLPETVKRQCRYSRLSSFQPDDFDFLLNYFSNDKLKGLDFDQIYRFSQYLNIHQIKKACAHLPKRSSLDTAGFIELLERVVLRSNVRRSEVRKVTLDDLYGSDEVIRQLEIDLVTPLERPDLVSELGIKPKRGVLLYGPPGTGKTTIGRALAHRLRSKFFMIDGTVIQGSRNFYGVLFNTFEEAKANAPSILFIDDSDLLFENDDQGLYRYLLTMLDGLESESNSQVTIFLTAMNVSSLPPALIRSGRVELWLEMKLPDATARHDILKALLDNTKLHLESTDFEQLVEQTKGFSGADLQRLKNDALNRYAFDIAHEQKTRPAAEYITEALEQLNENRTRILADLKANKNKRVRLEQPFALP